MNRILICLASLDTWYGRWFRRILNAPTYHAVIIYKSDEWNEWMSIIPGRDGMEVLPAKRVISEDIRVECYEYIDDLDKGLRGTRYYPPVIHRTFDLLWAMFRAVLWRVFRVEALFPARNMSKWFYTEYCAEVLYRARVDGTEDWIAAPVVPRDLRNLFLGRREFRQVISPIYK